METKSTFIAHPTTPAQLDALMAVVKEHKVAFEFKKERPSKKDKSEKNQILDNIRQGFKEMKQIQEGKVKGTSLKDFLDDL